jgi:flagellar biosynthetic protein FliQ
MTLTYVPKIICVGIVMALFGSWMLTTLVSFTRLCFDHAARVMMQ